MSLPVTVSPSLDNESVLELSESIEQDERDCFANHTTKNIEIAVYERYCGHASCNGRLGVRLYRNELRLLQQRFATEHPSSFNQNEDVVTPSQTISDSLARSGLEDMSVEVFRDSNSNSVVDSSIQSDHDDISRALISLAAAPVCTDIEIKDEQNVITNPRRGRKPGIWKSLWIEHGGGSEAKYELLTGSEKNDLRKRYTPQVEFISPPNIQSEPHDDSKFKYGDSVEGDFENKNKFYPATIVGTYECDDVYDIRYFDGDIELKKSVLKIRKIGKRKVTHPLYEIPDVIAPAPKKSKKDVVSFRKTSNEKAFDVKPEIGYYVRAHWRSGSYYDATIIATHRNNTFDVKFIDDGIIRRNIHEEKIFVLGECVPENKRKKEIKYEIKKKSSVSTCEKKANVSKCAICLDLLVSNTMKLPCNHVYHSHCVKSLVSYNSSNTRHTSLAKCPECRETHRVSNTNL